MCVLCNSLNENNCETGDMKGARICSLMNS